MSSSWLGCTLISKNNKMWEKYLVVKKSMTLVFKVAIQIIGEGITIQIF